MPAHAPEGGVVQEAVVVDVGQHTFAGLLDEVLPEADELHVVVTEPVLAFVEVLTVHVLIVLDQPTDPFAFVGADAAIRRVPQHHHHGRIALHGVGLVGLLA